MQSFAQTTIAHYSSGGGYTVDLSSSEKQTIWDTIAARLNLRDCTLDSVGINDDDPLALDSAAYIVFYASCSGKSYSIGFFLTKQMNHETTDYLLSSDDAEKAWSCQSNGNCPQCHGKRNWFLGPVVGCECIGGDENSFCQFSTSGHGLTYDALLGILWLLLSYF